MIMIVIRLNFMLIEVFYASQTRLFVNVLPMDWMTYRVE